MAADAQYLETACPTSPLPRLRWLEPWHSRGHHTGPLRSVSNLHQSLPLLMPLLHACPSCGVAHEYKGRCPRCKTTRDKTRNQRAKHVEIWNTPAWRKARALAIRRDHACQSCGHEGTRANPLTAHHAEGYEDAFNPDFLVVLCRSCHGAQHGGQRSA